MKKWPGFFTRFISSSYKTTLWYLHYCYEERRHSWQILTLPVKGNESYCFWKRLFMFLKGSVSASIETDSINHNHFNGQLLGPPLTGLCGNCHLTWSCQKQWTVCLVWWFWICRCGLFSQSMNGNYTRISGWQCVWYTNGEHYLFQTGKLHWCSNSDTGLSSHVYTKQALESLKIHQGFPTLALVTFWVKSFLVGVEGTICAL